MNHDGRDTRRGFLGKLAALVSLPAISRLPAGEKADPLEELPDVPPVTEEDIVDVYHGDFGSRQIKLLR